MEILVDTHSHTLVSGHAYSTIREMARAAKEHGMEALALTEHAPQMPGTCGLFYFSNLGILPEEIEGIRVLHGAELNILDTQGNVDLPAGILEKLDITIASIHPPCFLTNPTLEEIMNGYISAMNNPYIDIIGHPDDGRFPVDYERLVKAAKETGTLLEVNNSSMSEGAFRLNAWENIMEMLHYCKEYKVFITTGSDAHFDEEAGIFDNVKKVLKEAEFPQELVATSSLERFQKCLKRRG